MAETLHFHSKEDYDKWVAHIHMHNLGSNKPASDKPKVVIHGKAHHVIHKKK